STSYSCNCTPDSCNFNLHSCNSTPYSCNFYPYSCNSTPYSCNFTPDSCNSTSYSCNFTPNTYQQPHYNKTTIGTRPKDEQLSLTNPLMYALKFSVRPRVKTIASPPRSQLPA